MRLILHLFCINLVLICTTQAQNKSKIKISNKEWQGETIILEKTDQHFIPDYYEFADIQPHENEYIFELDQPDFYRLTILDKSYGLHLQPNFTYTIDLVNGSLTVESEDPLNQLLHEQQQRFEVFQKNNTNLLGQDKKNYDRNYLKYIEEIKEQAALNKLTQYAEEIIFYEIKYKEFNALESTQEFKQLENEIIEKGVITDNKAFITLINEIYPVKANLLKLREAEVNPEPTLYLLDEVKYVPNDTLQQLVELVMINEIIYGSYSFEPNDSLIDISIERTLKKALNPQISQFARVLDNKMNQLKKGESVPDFSFDLLNQPAKNLSDYKGQYVLLDFWFSGCKPCLNAIPKLNQLDKTNNNLTLIGIDPVDNEERFIKAIDKFNIKYAQTLVDGNSDLPSYFNVNGYPTYILIGPEGNYLAEFNSENFDEIEGYIK
jgi:thiol-disulfide isomerase/thioredoxin